MHSLQDSEVVARKVVANNDGLQICLKDGPEFYVPFNGWPAFARATQKERTNFHVIGGGEGIHWPDLDEDLSIRGLLRDFGPAAVTPVSEVPHLIADLYKVTCRLGKLFDDRPFTPDGHLVGSIGEVVAKFIYDLRLEPCSTPQIDARTRDEKTVQIKLTGNEGRSYGFRWPVSNSVAPPELLICLKLTQSGFEEVYAGRFPMELLTGRAETSNGQLGISISKLRSLNPRSIPQVKSLAAFNDLFRSELETAA